ncbi:hypothetical protein [Flavobacterium polysaccharolyticum]|uniref:Uncharacterized protein n=1 Tax=Flavobacterium polysaccharolyticum TaxID=3133148 RepID=A0ABU9NU56_9FLAO
MGLAASIDIILKDKLDMSFFTKVIFDKNWSYNDNSEINYIELNELDFDWVSKPINLFESVMKEISEKMELKQDIGLVIIHNKSHIGGQLIYFIGDNTISFNLNINRKTIEESNKTCFEWYLKNYGGLFEHYGILKIDCIEF